MKHAIGMIWFKNVKFAIQQVQSKFTYSIEEPVFKINVFL